MRSLFYSAIFLLSCSSGYAQLIPKEQAPFSKMFFVETFEDNSNNWSHIADTSSLHSAKINKGILEISNPSKKPAWGVTIERGIEYSHDFEIQLSFMIEKGSKKNRCYGGIYWGGTDSSGCSWVYLGKRIGFINCMGDDHKKDKSKYKRLHPALKEKTWHHLNIKKVANMYSVFLDDKLQLEMPYQQLKGDKISLAAGQGYTLKFDNLKINY